MKLRRKCCCNIGSENVLLIATVTAVVLGIVVGVGIQASGVPLTPKQVVLLKFPGEIFIRALKMIILPLITSSLITSLATLDSGSAGKIGIRAFLFYFCTTLLAVTVGLILVVAIQPGFRGGKSNTEDGAKKSEKKLEECFGGGAGDTILDLIRNIFPVNIVKAMISAQQTCYRFEEEVGNETRKLPIKEALTRLKSNDTSAKLISQIPRTRITTSMNILGMVVFSIIFGIVLGKYQSKCQALIDVFAALEFAIMKIVMVIIWFSPIGILFLIAGQIVAVTDPVAEMKRLAWYILTVLIGLGIHGCITLLVILALLGRRNPFRFIAGLSQALLTALGTSSSSATMPLTMKCLEENLDVDSRVVRFMIPLGATVNMDGTALYEAVACIYISQYAGMHLNVGEVILTR